MKKEETTFEFIREMSSKFLDTSTHPSFSLSIKNDENKPPQDIEFWKGIEDINDERIKHKDGIDVLFSGCSITMSAGIDRLANSWSYCLYKDIKKDYIVNGYKNIAMGGSSVIDILINTSKYIYEYGSPKYIFLLLPNFGRDVNKFYGDFEISTKMTYNIYYLFEQLCKDKGINLVSTTWADRVEGVTDWIATGSDNYEEETLKLFLKFDTFFKIDHKDFAKNVFGYINNNKNGQGIIGDDFSHPGAPIHFGFYKEMKKQYDALQ